MGEGKGHGRLKDKPDAVDGGGGEGLVHGISRRGVRFRFSRLRLGRSAGLSMDERNASEKAGKGEDG